MPIPKYDEMMLPLLQLLGDGQEHHQRDLAAQIAEQFHLSDEERNLMLPSTQSTYVRNRTVGPASICAGLVSRSCRAKQPCGSLRPALSS